MSFEKHSNELINIPGGVVKMGKDHLEEDFYGWDNEFGGEVFNVPDF